MFAKSRVFVRWIAVSSLFSLVACGQPFLLLPGGKLDGVTEPAPGDWKIADDVSTIQLETRPLDPYSVNIWVLGMGPFLYVHAGANRSTWVEHIEDDPNVRVRIEDQIYELRATRVESQDEFNQFSDGYEAKYGTRPRVEDASEAYLFRLEARTGASH
jgi:hypothetical protein